ncbi:hypothetical protein Hanom_Chr02g00121241 [Helianthus anomalus]
MKTIHVATSVGPRLASDVKQCEPKGEGNFRRDVQASLANVLWFGQKLRIKQRRVIVSCGCQDVLWYEGVEVCANKCCEWWRLPWLFAVVQERREKGYGFLRMEKGVVYMLG